MSNKPQVIQLPSLKDFTRAVYNLSDSMYQFYLLVRVGQHVYIGLTRLQGYIVKEFLGISKCNFPTPVKKLWIWVQS